MLLRSETFKKQYLLVEKAILIDLFPKPMVYNLHASNQLLRQ